MTNAHVVSLVIARESEPSRALTYTMLSCVPKRTIYAQVSNETTVHVRRPGNPKKWRAKVLCEGKIADLALVTVEDGQFWTDELLDLHFVDVPELQARMPLHDMVLACMFAGSHCGLNLHTGGVWLAM